MSGKMNHAKVNTQKRITDEYRRYGDPCSKAMFANGEKEIGESSRQLAIIRKAKRKQKR
jgi:hypothetical protein